MGLIDNWYFIGAMAVLCIALIGFYLFLRNQRPD